MSAICDARCERAWVPTTTVASWPALRECVSIAKHHGVKMILFLCTLRTDLMWTLNHVLVDKTFYREELLPWATTQLHKGVYVSVDGDITMYLNNMQVL